MTFYFVSPQLNFTANVCAIAADDREEFVKDQKQVNRTSKLAGQESALRRAGDRTISCIAVGHEFLHCRDRRVTVFFPGFARDPLEIPLLEIS